MAALEPALGHLGTVLEVAPSAQTTPLLAALDADQLVRIDFGFDGRPVDVLGSLTDLPLDDRCIDFLVCSNVLEHIPDDRAAMREIARVLRPGGLGLVQVPFRPDVVTDEDPSAPEDERILRFGQADHVRWYGSDFEDRLAAAGLALSRVSPRLLVGDALSAWLRLAPDELWWLVRPATGPAGAVVPPPTVRAVPQLVATFDALLRTVCEQQATAERQQSRVLRLRGERRQLEERLAEAERPGILRRAGGRAVRAARARTGR
jgi:SAM-dependent methyltransferase